ncbi:MAG: TlpA family protein disulfide reductase [Oscillospiraceae bacterium]|nr:TlpA family protein disulfide reductase [Oscillospiraceae bacterium]
MKNKSLLIILALLVVILLAAVPLYRNLSGTVSDPAPTVSQPQATAIPAPDFTFTTLEGQEVRLSDYFGKPIVLNFWASNCIYCVYEMPSFQQAYELYGEEVQFLMVNVTSGRWDSEATAREYLESVDYTLPFFLNTDDDATAPYDLYGLPVTYFLNAEGNLVGKRSGMLSHELLLGGIDLIHH